MKRTELLRRTPLRRTGALRRTRRKPRAAGTGCQMPRCRREAFRTNEGLRRCAVHEADRLVGAFVKARDKACIRCGAEGPLDWAHVISGRRPSLRWSVGPYIAHPYNASVALCRPCHRWQGEHPGLGRQFFQSRGIDVVRLQRLALEMGPADPEDVVVEFEVA